MAKQLIDYMSTEDYNRYNELLAKANEAKANAPRKARGPMTTDQKKKMLEARMAKAQAALDALLASEGV